MKSSVLKSFARSLAGVTLCVSSLTAIASPIEILVPAYFYPSFNGSAWDQLTAQVQLGTPITAIMNPASGPGASANSDYINAINRFRSAGGKVLGYVPTGYAGSSVNAGSSCQAASGTNYQVSDVLACANNYKQFYTIDGIFLDEFTNDNNPTSLAFYRSLYNGIKGRSGINANWRIVGNPGTAVTSNYFDLTAPTADTIVTFEGRGTNYLAYVNPPALAGTRAAQYAHLVYDVADPALATQFLARAQIQNIGSIFIGSDNFCGGAPVCNANNSDFNPWDTLPIYFGELSAQVRAANSNVPLPPSAWLLAFGLIPLVLARSRNLTVIACRTNQT
jgi:Spherulation-specific family 4